MKTLKKALLDLKWILERGENVLSDDRCHAIQDALLKTSTEIKLRKSEEDAADAWLRQNDPKMKAATPTKAAPIKEDAADAWLRQNDPKMKAATPAPTTQANVPPAKAAADVKAQEVSGGQDKVQTPGEWSKNKLHPIHTDPQYRKTVQDYAKEYTRNEQAKIAREAVATENRDKAIKGHATHISGPAHSLPMEKMLDEHKATVGKTPEWAAMSPREQYKHLATKQKEHWEANPEHESDFVDSGVDRTNHANAAYAVRDNELKEDLADVTNTGGAGAGGATMSSRELAEQMGDIGPEGARQGGGTEQSPGAKAAQQYQAGAELIRRANELKHKQAEAAANTKAASVNSMLTQRGDPEVLKRLQGIKPNKPAAEVETAQDAREKLGAHQDIIEQAEQKHADIADKERQARVAGKGVKTSARSLNHPVEKLAGEWIDKNRNMANSLIKQYGDQGGKVESHDLVRAGQQGFWEAVRDFDPDTDVFETLVARRVKRRMKDYLFNKGNVALPTRRKLKLASQAAREHEAEVNRHLARASNNENEGDNG